MSFLPWFGIGHIKGHLVLAIICKSNGQEGNCVDAYTFRSDATAKGTKGHY